jgi:hypothetical protein
MTQIPKRPNLSNPYTTHNFKKIFTNKKFHENPHTASAADSDSNQHIKDNKNSLFSHSE